MVRMDTHEDSEGLVLVKICFENFFYFFSSRKYRKKKVVPLSELFKKLLPMSLFYQFLQQ